MKLLRNALLACLLAASAQVSAGPLSDYLEGNLLGVTFQNTAFTPPTTIAVALGTACSDSSFTELANSGGYARVAVTANSTNFPGPTANNGTISNAASVTFPAATADWNSASTIGYWAMFDSATYGAGNLLVCAALTTPRAITNGATASFGASALSVTIDN
jgi:hypothetical protein